MLVKKLHGKWGWLLFSSAGTVYSCSLPCLGVSSRSPSGLAPVYKEHNRSQHVEIVAQHEGSSTATWSVSFQGGQRDVPHSEHECFWGQRNPGNLNFMGRTLCKGKSCSQLSCLLRSSSVSEALCVARPYSQPFLGAALAFLLNTAEYVMQYKPWDLKEWKCSPSAWFFAGREYFLGYRGSRGVSWGVVENEKKLLN